MSSTLAMTTRILREDALGSSDLTYTAIAPKSATFPRAAAWSGESEVSVSLPAVDFGGRDLKTLTSLSVSWTGEGVMYASCDVRYATGSDWVEAKRVKVNKRGYARLQVSGVDFRPYLSVINPDNVEIVSVELRYQNIGRQASRSSRSAPPQL